MTATEVATVVIAVASVVGVALLGVALTSISRSLRSVRDTMELVRGSTLRVGAEAGGAIRTANPELEAVDADVGAARSKSRVAYLAYSPPAVKNPVIKVLALATGTGRAARRFRDRADR